MELKMKNIEKGIWGVLLIVVGIILGLNALEITNISLLFPGWWTFFIIVPCFIHLFTKESKTGNIIGLIIGILLFLACQKVLDFEIVWKLSLPIILIIIGISFLFRNFIANKMSDKIKEINAKNKKAQSHIATFAEQKIDYSNEDFKGCSAEAFFGGVEIDLRDAKIKEDVVINANTIFGGINIRVPKDVNVKVNSNAIFGGVDNKHNSKEENKYTIYIQASCLFGGVDIK